MSATDFDKMFLLRCSLDANKLDANLVKEKLSYEMMMDMAIYHHKQAKEAAPRKSINDIDSMIEE